MGGEGLVPWEETMVLLEGYQVLPKRRRCCRGGLWSGYRAWGQLSRGSDCSISRHSLLSNAGQVMRWRTMVADPMAQPCRFWYPDLALVLINLIFVDARSDQAANA